MHLDVFASEACLGNFDILFKFFDQTIKDVQADFFLRGLTVYENRFDLVVKLEGS